MTRNTMAVTGRKTISGGARAAEGGANDHSELDLIREISDRQVAERKERERKYGEEMEMEKKKMDGREIDREEKSWFDWEKWGLSVGLVLFNILFAIPIAYVIAKYAVPAPWRWMGFILSHHTLLACGYEIEMDFKERIEGMERREAEEQRELQQWDDVVERLEMLLEESKRNRRVMEGVEVGIAGCMEDGEDGGMETKGMKREIDVARKRVGEKIKELEGLEKRGVMIDRALLGALKKERLELLYETTSRSNADMMGKWSGKSWKELCDAEGILKY
ncbi:hypothetical protein BOTCAL_0217g00060 [Botryotinia calthae]|uniref:Uncharacterized protein n=1 Tax=Botryotinia calthae TaxID=38488 RepID=A0A4Y8D0X3_9HELO|nr:hypothetical protein BOTCAL_0217g00060 [Botryotinia calthae]